VKQAGTHLLDVDSVLAAVKGTRPRLARAAVPLFYRPRLKHTLCQDGAHGAFSYAEKSVHRRFSGMGGHFEANFAGRI
jgi:hypothetical protein